MQIKIIILLVLGLVVTGLVGGIYYYKSGYEKVQGALTLANTQIEILKNTNESLKQKAAQVAKEMDGYVRAMDKLSESNLGLNLELGKLKHKLSKHKLTNLRNSRHSELVLKIINRSIAKQNASWMKLAPAGIKSVIDKKQSIIEEGAK